MTLIFPKGKPLVLYFLGFYCLEWLAWLDFIHMSGGPLTRITNPTRIPDILPTTKKSVVLVVDCIQKLRVVYRIEKR